ncbi:MAG: S8 family serine peptidase [Bdellovibrionota bacterium]
MINLKISLLTLAFGAQALAQATNDPFSSSQWGIGNKGAPQNIELDVINNYKIQGRAGRDINIGGAGVLKAPKKIIVAVLDTGIDTTHPDLKNVIVTKDSECKALAKYKACLASSDASGCNDKWINLNNPEVDQDKNGYPMDCQGWSTLGDINRLNIRGTPNMEDTIGHGTHVAGIIAAVRGNGVGIAGVSENVQILPVQVIGEKPMEPIKPFSLGDGTTFDPSEKNKEEHQRTLGDLIARGVVYAVNSGAQVINLSLGWPDKVDSVFLRNVIKEAQKKGVIFVAAAGNDSTRALLRPCSYPGVICVGAHGPDGALTYFSNYGTGVDIAAPGTQILSTYPLGIRSLRFVQQAGFEYLHGTSQASPFVAAAVAELLARGIPAADVLPRLLAGSRALEQKMPIFAGPANEMKSLNQPENPLVEKKWILSGALDIAAALKVSPREIIRPVSKERKSLQWDRQSSNLTIDFPLTNIWADFAADSLQLKVAMKAISSEAIRPRIVGSGLTNASGVWKRNEVRTLRISLQITDAGNPSQSRIPSDLDFVVSLVTPKSQSTIVLESEVIVPINANTVADESYSIEGLPQSQVTFLGLDEVYDKLYRVDYLVSEMEADKLIYHLFVPDSARRYTKKGSLVIRLGDDQTYVDDMDGKPEFALQRMMWKDQVFYGLGIRIDRRKDEKPSEAKFWLLDSQFKVVQKYSVTNNKTSLPSRLFWTEIGGQLRPVWIGQGVDPGKKPSLIDAWEKQSTPAAISRRLFYFDANGAMASMQKFEGLDVIDVLDTSIAQRMDGSIQILLSRNHGTEVKPSYLVDYSVASFKNQAITGLTKVAAADGVSFANLAEGTQDAIVTLDKGATSGTSWASTSKDRTMKITTIIDQGGKKSMTITPATAMRGIIDAALNVRSAYAGAGRKGAFVFTNSEMQYHDLNTGKSVSKSFERYTFYDSLSYAAFHYPVALANRDGGVGYPALYVTESVGFSRGLNIKTVQIGANGPVEVVSPAKLRFQSDVGCRPLENPVRTADGSSALDYRCGNKILRMKLVY